MLKAGDLGYGGVFKYLRGRKLLPEHQDELSAHEIAYAKKLQFIDGRKRDWKNEAEMPPPIDTGVEKATPWEFARLKNDFVYTLGYGREVVDGYDEFLEFATWDGSEWYVEACDSLIYTP